ncbi:MAG: tRNA (N(6)-L-threonylcarbamoyladenosine(37)-C(2))-methylthiotransferase MtaB [Gammaproteobacteria bacterium]|nr:tRNA (N(6)-L-threonylcarbamoyladenosine(37)-C(2))-methylthiotransferase MtaB [Gammaproteobacteria bacterium]
MNVFLQSLGCRVNEAELQRWAAGFLAAGCRVVPQPEQADLLVVNTCAVTQEAVRKSRQMIRRARRASPTAKLVVSGCYASLDPKLRRDLSGIDLLVHNDGKDELVDRVRRELIPQAMPALAQRPGEAALFARGRSRAFIKVQDGCRYRCSYCIVTVARGAERSRPVEEILDEIRALVAAGVKEVVLTGVHIGGYGSDSGENLALLIRRVLRESGVSRLRLGSLEPWDLGEEFLELFDDPRMMPHLHLPLQSGCDAVLRRMARRTQTRGFAQLVKDARARVPDLNITTDIIVGFPGETDAQWRQGLAFIREMGFAHVHIFPYSRREGTRAASMPDPVPDPVRRARVGELDSLARSMRAEFLGRFCGRTLPVLMENAGRGYTPNYLPVRTPPAALHGVNEVVEMRIRGISQDANALIGEPAWTPALESAAAR